MRISSQWRGIGDSEPLKFSDFEHAVLFVTLFSDRPSRLLLFSSWHEALAIIAPLFPLLPGRDRQINTTAGDSRLIFDGRHFASLSGVRELLPS